MAGPTRLPLLALALLVLLLGPGGAEALAVPPGGHGSTANAPLAGSHANHAPAAREAIQYANATLRRASVNVGLSLLGSGPSAAGSTSAPRPLHVLIQYGPPRTASTTQFQLLCAIAQLRTAGGAVCAFARGLDGAARLLRHERVRARRLLVLKTHDDFAAILSAARAHGWTPHAFTSAPTPAPIAEPCAAHLSSADYFREGFPLLERAIRTAYRPYFGLTRRAAALVADYMRTWENLRRCCGFQMSRGFMEILQSGPAPGSGPGAGSGPGVGRRHFCVGKDVAQWERDLLRNRLAPLHPVLRQESQWPRHQLNGSWCAFAQAEVARGAGFNAAGPRLREIVEAAALFK
mgnify:CR=1 FL=1